MAILNQDRCQSVMVGYNTESNVQIAHGLCGCNISFERRHDADALRKQQRRPL